MTINTLSVGTGSQDCRPQGIAPLCLDQTCQVGVGWTYPPPSPVDARIVSERDYTGWTASSTIRPQVRPAPHQTLPLQAGSDQLNEKKDDSLTMKCDTMQKTP